MPRRRTMTVVGVVVALVAGACAGGDAADPPSITRAPADRAHGAASGENGEVGEIREIGDDETTASPPSPTAPPATATSATDERPTIEPGLNEGPGAAERIIVSDHALLDAALALDLPVAAIPDFADRQAIPTYLADRAADVEVLDVITDVNLELLAAARPDLLLMSEKLVENSGVESQLRQIAPLVAFDVSTARPWQDALRELGAIFGVDERAEQLISSYEQTVREASERLGSGALAREVSIVRCFGASCRYLPGDSSFSGQVLTDLGVARPEVQRSDPDGRPFVEVGPEQVDLLDGDLILLFGMGAEESLDSLRANPLWERLRAVQAGEVHLVDPEPWFFGNVLAAEKIVADIVEILTS